MGCQNLRIRPASPEVPAFLLLVRLIRLDKLFVMSETGLMTLDEAATYLGVSKVSLRRWTVNGQLRCVRVGSRRDRRFRRADLDSYIRKNLSHKHTTQKKSVLR